MYYSLASSSADGTDDQALFAALWEKHRAAWDRFVDLTDLQIERIEIPYEGTTLPGYFFRSGPAGQPRRTLIFNNGSDGPVTDAWVMGIADALARGWNAVTFDGPGQNAALVRQHLPFRPDWEKVITPVIDHLLTRPDADTGKIALLGVSQAGYWVPRSVAFEHRIAAAVADPGVVNVSAAMTRQVPHFLVKMIEAGEKEKFDKDMALALRFSPPTRSMMAFRMRPYGTTSPYEFFTAARAYALTDEVIGQITCPVLVTDPDHEQFWPGQSRELYDKLPAGKTLIRFTEERARTPTASQSATASAASAFSTGLTSTSRPEKRGFSAWRLAGPATYPGLVRLVSLLPSATEIVYALGLGADLAGVTFECDEPPEARAREDDRGGRPGHRRDDSRGDRPVRPGPDGVRRRTSTRCTPGPWRIWPPT